jgi:hypothetical protein
MHTIGIAYCCLGCTTADLTVYSTYYSTYITWFTWYIIVHGAVCARSALNKRAGLITTYHQRYRAYHVCARSARAHSKLLKQYYCSMLLLEW